MTRYFSLKTHWPTLLSILVAFIFLQSLFFKFDGADITVHIFQTVGQWLGLPWFEPYGRNFTAVAELIVSILILIPRTRILGALGGLFIMSGAIIFHLFSPLGVVVVGGDGTVYDNGSLFGMAVAAFIASIVTLFKNKDKVLHLLKLNIKAALTA